MKPMTIESSRAPAARRNLVRTTVAALLASAGVLATMGAAGAAEPAENEELTDVVVTGSRIVRRDYEANSPLVTVDSAALEQRSNLNVESYLNQLPSYNPAASPNVKGGAGSNSDVQISAVNSVGISSISLRGFGANRVPRPDRRPPQRRRSNALDGTVDVNLHPRLP
jgi:iron complex outermembrane recepter protein